MSQITTIAQRPFFSLPVTGLMDRNQGNSIAIHAGDVQAV
jgi:hypothetical protein